MQTWRKYFARGNALTRCKSEFLYAYENWHLIHGNWYPNDHLFGNHFSKSTLNQTVCYGRWETAILPLAKLLDVWKLGVSVNQPVVWGESSTCRDLSFGNYIAFIQCLRSGWFKRNSMAYKMPFARLRRSFLTYFADFLLLPQLPSSYPNKLYSKQGKSQHSRLVIMYNYYESSPSDHEKSTEEAKPPLPPRPFMNTFLGHNHK